MSAAPVSLTVEDGIAFLRLNRPEASNAMNLALLAELHEATLRCLEDPAIRVVLLTGEGRNFCAGGDVKEFASKGEDLPRHLRVATARLQEVTATLVSLPRPVVALVQGYAAGGGGLGLVCAADFVLAAETARFTSGVTSVGMAPDGGSSVTLSRIVGHRRAMEIVLTNRVLSAEEALAMGLVTRVVADAGLEAEGLTLARELAAGATLALGATKRLMWKGLGASVEACLPDEAATVSELSGTEDAREGLAAVIERRKPNFTGR